MTTSRKRARPIDRCVAGLGRLTIRTTKLTASARAELDRYIVRAVQEGQLEPLRLLKERRVPVAAFLEAARLNRLPGLTTQMAAAELLRPLLSRWLEESDLRESSRVRYKQSWAFLDADLPEDATLDHLTSKWWEDVLAVRRKVVGNATMNRDRAAYLAFRGWVKSKGYRVPDFPITQLEEEPHQSEILTVEQLDLIRRKCPAHRWPFFWALMGTGARQGEILNLGTADISRVPPLITIRSQPGSKSRGKVRHVPIMGDLAACLEIFAGNALSEKVFPYSRHTATRWWDQLAKDLEITGVTLHGFRATYITRALDSGVPPTEVQKLVGHSHIDMTMRYYRNTELSRSAAERVARALGLADSESNPPSVSHSGQAPSDSANAV